MRKNSLPFFDCFHRSQWSRPVGVERSRVQVQWLGPDPVRDLLVEEIWRAWSSWELPKLKATAANMVKGG